MRADLHIHTDASDGNLTRDELLRFAALRGLTHVAIADHDTMKNSYQAKGDPVRVIEAAELSAYDPNNGRKVHILCYLPKSPDELTPHFEHMKRERSRCGEEMVRLASKEFPELTLERVWEKAKSAGVIFKHHIMDVLIDVGCTNEIYGSLYKELFGSSSGRFTVNPDYPTVDECLECASRVRGVISLAHPSVYKSMQLARELAKSGRIDAIEAHHPLNKPQDAEELTVLCERHGLLATAGSDFHAKGDSHHSLPGERSAVDAEIQRLYELSALK